MPMKYYYLKVFFYLNDFNNIPNNIYIKKYKLNNYNNIYNYHIVIKAINTYQLPDDISSSLITIALFSSYSGLCFLLVVSIFNKYGYSINDDNKFKASFFNKNLMQKYEYNTCYNYLLSTQFDIVRF